MLKLSGDATATGYLKAVWALEELGLAYHRAESPVLHLQDGDFSLGESHAMLRYLCNAHASGGPLYPAAPRTRAEIDAWLDIQATAVEPPAHIVCTGMAQTGPRDEVAISAALRAWAGQWRALEVRLAKQRFIAGGQLTLADIAYGPALHRWFALRIPGQPAMPHVRAWYDMLLTRPAYRSHLALPMAQVQWANLPPVARPIPPAGHWFRYDANNKVLTAAAAQRAIRMPMLTGS